MQLTKVCWLFILLTRASLCQAELENISGPNAWQQLQQVQYKLEQSSVAEYDLQPQHNSQIKGIYLTQSTLANTNYLKFLIKKSQDVGINTFIIDIEQPNSKYAENIKLVQNAKINIVNRIVVFPGGATKELIQSAQHLQQRVALIDFAIEQGAQAIQLDYIRYATTNPANVKNFTDVEQIVAFFKKIINKRAKLQLAIFGETAFYSSPNIGQNAITLANHTDVFCPMLYPSHFEPHKLHAISPYSTLKYSIASLKTKIMLNKVKIYPYIELFNYRNDMSSQQLKGYIQAQIKAIEDTNADGWYAWSAGNKYDRLFSILQDKQHNYN